MQTAKAPKNGDILFKAHELINGQRQKDYGTPSQNFDQIANFWTIYLRRRCGLDNQLTSYDVANLMMLLKISRASACGVTPTEDCYVDIAGYAGLANDFCEEERELEREIASSVEPDPSATRAGSVKMSAAEMLLRDAARLDGWNASEDF